MEPIYLIIVLLVFAGMIWLQIVLSKRKNKWLGLILPLVTVCFSILAISVTPTYVTKSPQTVVEREVTQSGEVVENIITNIPQEGSPGAVPLFFTGAYLFLLYNIPTAILLIIYALCRSQQKNKMELERMNIQDLA
jgi:hypothetical protein